MTRMKTIIKNKYMNKFTKTKERLKELIENQYLIIDGAKN